MTQTAKPGNLIHKRGFASFSPEKRRAVASKAGKTAHANGTAHKWTSEEARRVGKIGGKLSRRDAPLTEKERARVLAELAATGEVHDLYQQPYAWQLGSPLASRRREGRSVSRRGTHRGAYPRDDRAIAGKKPELEERAIRGE